MGKQAIGIVAANTLERVDTYGYLLTYPQRPLVGSRVMEWSKYNELPAGHNAVIAVMSYSVNISL